MKVIIGSDHAGYELKEKVKKHLESKDIEVFDVGTNSLESVDYPKFGYLVGENVIAKKADFGIVVCGTGIGISIAANKVKGIRAALIYDTNTARLAKEHNNANVIALGGRTTKEKDAYKMIDTFIETKFEERHQRRLDLISKLEGQDE